MCIRDSSLFFSRQKIWECHTGTAYQNTRDKTVDDCSLWLTANPPRLPLLESVTMDHSQGINPLSDTVVRHKDSDVTIGLCVSHQTHDTVRRWRQSLSVPIATVCFIAPRHGSARQWIRTVSDLSHGGSLKIEREAGVCKNGLSV